MTAADVVEGTVICDLDGIMHGPARVIQHVPDEWFRLPRVRCRCMLRGCGGRHEYSLLPATQVEVVVTP